MLRIASFLILTNALFAQDYIPVFELESGEELLISLREEYTPSHILTYSEARDTLFSKIDQVNDSLTCVYSGHTIYLDPEEDPTQAAFMNGAYNGINTEHTYPQSKGAGNGNARSDMHHLFPTWNIANSVRGAKPFSEIEDLDTELWLHETLQQSSIPHGAVKDEFSESTFLFFEPKEDHKGDVARAIFYFYTIYNEEANAKDSDYFWDQVNTLCQWHLDDPVDQKEWGRTFKIASYQDGKVNPFVLDCTLAFRTYCEMTSCLSTDTEELNEVDISVFPNPASAHLQVEVESEVQEIKVRDFQGNDFDVTYINTPTGIEYAVSNLPNGSYLIQITSVESVVSKIFIVAK